MILLVYILHEHHLADRLIAGSSLYHGGANDVENAEADDNRDYQSLQFERHHGSRSRNALRRIIV